MIHPTHIRYDRRFSVTGTVTAISLTKSLPQGVDVDILVLGLDDVRNILYTAYMEAAFPSRKLDITCCDLDDHVLARNILFVTLILDGDKATIDSTWKIYYDMYLDAESLDLVRTQVARLLGAAESLESWAASKYGRVVRFDDFDTFHDVRSIWTSYAGWAADADSPSCQKEFEANMMPTKDFLEGLPDGHHYPLALTSGSPCARISPATNEDLGEPFHHYWRHGVASGVFQGPRRPNPTFAAAFPDRVGPEYTTDPLLGFHLATAFSPLAATSPLRPEPVEDPKFATYAAAKVQFTAWVEAFRMIRERVILRFVGADALAFCQTLQHCVVSSSSSSSSSGESSCANWYRRPFDRRLLVLAEEAHHATAGSAPKTFDVIDGSALADDIDCMNLLVSAAPLLKELPWATLSNYVRVSVKSVTDLFCPHIPTLSLLFGVTPSEYWTNETTESVIEETLIAMSERDAPETKGIPVRMSWKRVDQFSGEQEEQRQRKVKVDPTELARLLFDFYRCGPPINGVPRASFPPEVAAVMPSQYHRGGWVALHKLVSRRLDVDFERTRAELRGMILGEHGDGESSTAALHCLHETGMHMHLNGFDCAAWLDPLLRNPSLGGIFAWHDIPEVVAVTLVVPRDRFKRVREALGEERERSIPVRCLVASSPGAVEPHTRFFHEVHLMFGRIRTVGDRDSADFALQVEDGSAADLGSPLLASFYMPSCALQIAPWAMTVRLAVMPTLSWDLEGDSMFCTRFDDLEHVYLSRYMPGQLGYAVIGGGAPATTTAATTATVAAPGPATAPAEAAAVTRSFRAGAVGGRFATITGRMEIASPAGKKLLRENAPISLHQTTPFVINVTLGNKKFMAPMHYPLPVERARSKTIVARKSAYIEVTVPFAEPTGGGSGALANFAYPTIISPSMPPATLNATHLNLEMLPIVELPQKAPKPNWLSSMLDYQYSDRELDLRRERHLTVRALFRDLLFTMFLASAGQQGRLSGQFTLKNLRGGIHVLIFVSAIRVDGAAHSVVLDAAVITLTEELNSNEGINKFLTQYVDFVNVPIRDQEWALWKEALPAMAERCRTWQHVSGCEYRRPGANAPLSLGDDKPVFCSCGRGKLPPKFVSVPQWDETLAEHAVRVAISPTYPVAVVERLINDGDVFGDGLMRLFLLPGSIERCHSCGGAEGIVKLKECTGCEEVKYCSKKCLMEDWTMHQAECNPPEMETEDSAEAEGPRGSGSGSGSGSGGSGSSGVGGSCRLSG